MFNSVIKQGVRLEDRDTTVSLEEEFWLELRAMAKRLDMPLAKLVGGIDELKSPRQNLSSAVRVYVLKNKRN